jgi:hypothetical protein
MPIQLKIPQPGDLITADYMRDLVTALQQLDLRVSALEDLVPGAAGQLAIAELRWPLADLHIGDELTIIGANLGLQGETRVDFADLASVTVFKPGSTERKLILDVPAMALGGESKKLALTVTNPRTGVDSRTVTVFQGLPTRPDGTINISPAQFPAGTIQPAADLVIAFPLAIQNLNMDTVFNIATSANLLTSPPVVMTAVALNDANQPITTIALSKAQQPTTRTIKVKVTIPVLPLGVTRADANVIVALGVASNPALAPSSGMVPFTVGQPAPVSAFSFDITGVQSPGSYDAPSATLHLPPATAPAGGYLVGFSADLSGMTAGEAYTVTLRSSDTHWTFTGPTNFTLSVPGAQALTYRVAPAAGAPAATLTMTITGTNAAHTAQKAFALQPT